MDALALRLCVLSRATAVRCVLAPAPRARSAVSMVWSNGGKCVDARSYARCALPHAPAHQTDRTGVASVGRSDQDGAHRAPCLERARPSRVSSCLDYMAAQGHSAACGVERAARDGRATSEQAGRTCVAPLDEMLRVAESSRAPSRAPAARLELGAALGQSAPRLVEVEAEHFARARHGGGETAHVAEAPVWCRARGAGC